MEEGYIEKIKPLVNRMAMSSDDCFLVIQLCKQVNLLSWLSSYIFKDYVQYQNRSYYFTHEMYYELRDEIGKSLWVNLFEGERPFLSKKGKLKKYIPNQDVTEHNMIHIHKAYYIERFCCFIPTQKERMILGNIEEMEFDGMKSDRREFNKMACEYLSRTRLGIDKTLPNYKH